jgi:hypothetical protein
MWATYEEWKHNGRVVEMGNKSELRDPDGKALFHHRQTIVPAPAPALNEWCDDYLFAGMQHFYND